jgi:hypothetical protein
MKARLIRFIVATVVAAICMLAAALLGTDTALAHGTYPSSHRAFNYGCGYYSTTGKWSLMSGVEMYRADGYTPGVLGTGGSVVDPMTGAITGTSGSWSGGNTQQWLYYQVVVGTQLSNGTWYWNYGNWIARKDQLGEGTDGVSTWIQQPDGRWLTSSYSNVGYFDGTRWVGSGVDVSIVTKSAAEVPLGRKYVYGHLVWGPINSYPTGQRVFPGYEHWEPLGYVTCS